MSAHASAPAIRTTRRRRLPNLLVAFASLVAVVGLSSGGDVAHADPQTRVVVTSPRTGVKYNAIHSCAATHPKFSARGVGRLVRIELVEVVDGVEDPTPLIRFIGTRVWGETRSFEFRPPNALETRNVEWIVRDRFDGETTSQEVFRITPQNCPDYAPTTVSSFRSIEPTRVLDTRPGRTPTYSGPRPGPGTVIDIPKSALPGAPDGLVAVSLTVTLAGSDGRGFVQVYPTGRVTPGGTANVNAAAGGETAGNLAVVPVGNGDGISVFTSVGAHLIVDVNGYFVSSAGMEKAGRLESITPKRLFDTRPENPINSTGTKVPAGGTVRVDLTAESSGLPPGATAAIVNITATRSIEGGFIQAAAGGTLVPGATAVTNLPGPNQTRGGLAIVPLAPDGSIDLYSSGGADLVVDLTGWFTGDTALESTKGLFAPVTPERIYDKRTDSIVNHESGFDETDSGVSTGIAIGIPAVEVHAAAVFINATAINPSHTGFVAFNSGSSGTSNLNFTPGSVVANAAIVPLAGRKSIAIRFGNVGRMDLTADMSGYFTK